MRIGINCFFLQPHVGGMKHYVLNLLYLLLTSDTGNTYTLFCFPHNEPVLAERGADWWQEHAIMLDRIEEIRDHLADIDVYFSPINGLQPLPLPPLPMRPLLLLLPPVLWRIPTRSRPRKSPP